MTNPHIGHYSTEASLKRVQDANENNGGRASPVDMHIVAVAALEEANRQRDLQAAQVEALNTAKMDEMLANEASMALQAVDANPSAYCAPAVAQIYRNGLKSTF